MLCNEVARNKTPPSSSVAVVFVQMPPLISSMAGSELGLSSFCPLLTGASKAQATSVDRKTNRGNYITDKNQEERDKTATL